MREPAIESSMKPEKAKKQESGPKNIHVFSKEDEPLPLVVEAKGRVLG